MKKNVIIPLMSCCCLVMLIAAAGTQDKPFIRRDCNADESLSTRYARGFLERIDLSGQSVKQVRREWTGSRGKASMKKLDYAKLPMEVGYPGETYSSTIHGERVNLKQYATQIDLLQSDTSRTHPAIGRANCGEILYAFERYPHDGAHNIFWCGNEGDPGDPASCFVLTGDLINATYPSIDYFGNGETFYGTMVPPVEYHSGARTLLVEVTDVDTPYTSSSITSWKWENHGYHDMKMAEIASHYNPMRPWHWGLQSLIHSKDTEPPVIDAPMIFYQLKPDTGRIFYWTKTGCQGTDADIDHDTEYAYAVWDFYNSSRDQYQLLVYKAPIGDLEDGLEWWSWWFTDSTWNVGYPVVAADDGSVIILFEAWDKDNPADHDIVCWYNTEGDIGSLEGSEVIASDADERHPEVADVGPTNEIGNLYLCTFVRDGDALYSSGSSDKGVTWSDPPIEIALPPPEEVLGEYRMSDMSEMGHFKTEEADSICRLILFFEYYPNAANPANIQIHFVEFDCGACCMCDTLAPSTPQGLVATSGDTSVNLAWNPIPDEDFRCYGIYRGTNSGFTPADSNRLGITTDSIYNDSEVIIDSTYYYRVSTFDLA